MLGIDINNVGPITKRGAGLLHNSVNVINGKPRFQYVPLGDEDHVGFPESGVAIPWFRQIGIQKAAVVTRPMGIRSLVPTLDFNIVALSVLVNRKNIQPNGTPL